MADEAALISPSLLHSLREVKQSIWYRIGTLHDEMNDHEAALTAFEKVLVHNPSNSDARAKAGILLMKKECYRDAISYLHSAVSLNPDNPPAWVALAYSYVMSDELDSAYQAYHTAMSKMSHHNDPTLWFGIGIMYDCMGLLDHALDAFHAVLNIAPHFDATDKLCYDIGLIYKEQHKYELAHKYMTRVVSTKIQQPMAYAEALYQIGHIHELAGNVPSAMEAYHGALTRNPNHIKCLQSLGWLTYKSGNVDEAARLLGHASQIEPTDAYTFYMIGRMAMATNDYHKAYNNYQHAVYRDGKNANFWCAIGILYFHMRQHRDAMDAYTRAIRINPQMPEVWYDMGTLYEVYNQTADAMDAYRRVLQLQPNDSQARQRLATLEHAASNSVMPPAPTALPRTDGPVVSPNPASAARTHTRSDAPKRIGALPPPPRVPEGTNIAVSAPAPYQIPIPTATPRSDVQGIQGDKPIGAAPMPTTPGQVDPKVGSPNPNLNGSAMNGIVVDSAAYPGSSQPKKYSNGGPGIMIGNGPSGYSTMNDRRNTVTGIPSTNAPEASSQLSSLNKQHTAGNFATHSGPQQDPGSCRSADRIPPHEKIQSGVSSGQVMSVSQGQNPIAVQAPQANGSPSEGLPHQAPISGPAPAYRSGEKQNHWNCGSRQNTYEDNRVVRSDSNRIHPVQGEVNPDQPLYGVRGPAQPNTTSVSSAPRSVYHNEQNDPGRSQPFQSQADKSPGYRGLPPQQRPAGPVAPLASSMRSDDRSRLSASSSYERRATPAEGLRSNAQKDTPRTSGDGSVRSAENENRYGSPGSRNSRRSLPAPLQGPTAGFSGRPQGMNIANMNRGDDQLDEAMLPRLRPLPNPKSASPGTESGKKSNAPMDREGPADSVRRLDNGKQSGTNGNWADPASQDNRRVPPHGTSQQPNGGSPRSQPSPRESRLSREQTGLSRSIAGTQPREYGYGNAQTPMEGQQLRAAQQSSDGRNGANTIEPSRFNEERTGAHLKQYSSQASMSSHDARADGSSEVHKVEEQAGQQPPPAMRSESYGGNRPFPAGSSPTPRVENRKSFESERDQLQPSGSNPERTKMSPPNGFHSSAVHATAGEGGDPASATHDVRPMTKVATADAHFGSGKPASFSKSLPRSAASNGLTPIGGKDAENMTGPGRNYYDRPQGTYGSEDQRPPEASGGYNRSPRGSKRKLPDHLGDGRAERLDGKMYARERGDNAIPEGTAVSSGITRPNTAILPPINARALGEPIGTARGEAEEVGHSRKRMRSLGMNEDGLGAHMNGGQLKSRE